MINLMMYKIQGSQMTSHNIFIGIQSGAKVDSQLFVWKITN